MTTKELISKAHEIASKYFDVEKITFSHQLVTGINEYRITLECFYSYKEYCMYEAEMAHNQEDYSGEELLRRFKKATKKEHQRHFPQEPGTTNFILEL